MVKMNRGEPSVKFLSNIVKGEAYVDTPDGCNHSTDLKPYEEIMGMSQPGSDLPESRNYGARSGVGKKTSVV
jgi:hypothetical protein